MGYDDFDTAEDDLSEMLIMDEMDAEDERMNRGGGCLTTALMMMLIPAAIVMILMEG